MQTFKEAIILLCSMIIIVHESLGAIVRTMCFLCHYFLSTGMHLHLEECIPTQK